MMIFNSFTVANDYNFVAQWPSGRGRRFFFPTNKTFEGICLALAWPNPNRVEAADAFKPTKVDKIHPKVLWKPANCITESF